MARSASGGELASLHGYTLPAPSGAAPRCHLSELAVVPFGGGAGGTFYARVSVHNVSARTCSLRGRPAIALIDKYGHIFQSNGPDREHRPIRTVGLSPNSWARADLGAVASDICGGDQTRTLQISLPGQHASRTLRFPVGRPPQPKACGGRVVGATPHPGQLQVGPFQAIPKPQDDFLLIRNLKARLLVPAQVRPGTTMAFSVEFTNPSPDNSNGIDDNPCPIFQMQLRPVTPARTYLLPCTPFIDINPGKTVAFQMRMPVPATAAFGPATLEWQLREPDEPALSATTIVSDQAR